MKLYGKTSVGMVRDTNQDSFTTGVITNDTCYMIVCDGMGGASGGQIASDIAVNALKKTIEKMYDVDYSDREVENMLKLAVINANREVYEKAESDESLSGMGTTAIVAFTHRDFVTAIYIGDSRAYKIRNNEIMKLSKDHSVVQTLIELGEITEKEAQNHPQKNIITKALGIEKDIEPDVFTTKLLKNDILFLCTDGLYNMVESEEILKLSKNNTLDRFVNGAISTANNNGGSDNITIVALLK